MVHGTPTWSFLYRHLVKGLRDRYPLRRARSPGLRALRQAGRRSLSARRPGPPASRALVETLGLKDLTLVVHDFGGPIGLAYALEHPENVRRLVIFNTWMWSLAGDRRSRAPAACSASPARPLPLRAAGRLASTCCSARPSTTGRATRAPCTRSTPRRCATGARTPPGSTRASCWARAPGTTGSGSGASGIAAIPALLRLGDEGSGVRRATCRAGGRCSRSAEVVELADVRPRAAGGARRRRALPFLERVLSRRYARRRRGHA